MIRALFDLFRATLELGYRELLALPCRLGDHEYGELRNDHPFCHRCGQYLDENGGQ